MVPRKPLCVHLVREREPPHPSLISWPYLDRSPGSTGFDEIELRYRGEDVLFWVSYASVAVLPLASRCTISVHGMDFSEPACFKSNKSIT
jgi:hypothetical protein